MIFEREAPLAIHVTRIHPRAQIPQYQTADAAAFDLATVEDLTVEPGRVALAPTGLVVRVPLRMFLGIFARSSLPVRRGLMVANGVGVIDPDYCGATDEIKVALLNFTDAPIAIRAGDRVAQGIFLEAPRVSWIEAAPSATARGGFGSSGT